MFRFLMRIFQQMDMCNGFLYRDKSSTPLLLPSMHFLAKVLIESREREKSGFGIHFTVFTLELNIMKFQPAPNCVRLTFNPTGQMAANMINFPCVLSFTTRPIFIRFIDYDFDTAASPFTFITTFFLHIIKRRIYFII